MRQLAVYGARALVVLTTIIGGYQFLVQERLSAENADWTARSKAALSDPNYLQGNQKFYERVRVVGNERVNVREGPGLDRRIIGKVWPGETISGGAVAEGQWVAFWCGQLEGLELTHPAETRPIVCAINVGLVEGTSK